MILAVAQSETIHFPRSVQHQLDTMVRALPADNAVTAEFSAVVWLEAYATTFRYPRTQGGITQPPSNEKLSATLEAIRDLLDRLTMHFGVSLATKDEPAKHGRPPR